MYLNEPDVVLIPNGFGTQAWAIEKIADRLDLIEMEIESLRTVLGWSEPIVDQALECLHKARIQADEGNLDGVRVELNNVDNQLRLARPPEFSEWLYRCTMVVRTQTAAVAGLTLELARVVKTQE